MREAVIPLNKRGTKNPEKLSVGNPICETGLAMSKDGKTTDGSGQILPPVLLISYSFIKMCFSAEHDHPLY